MKKHVTFEQAKLLKEKGFNYKVTKFKDLVTNTEIDNAPLGNYNLTSQSVSIPEQHEVVDWLWETYLIDVSTIPIREKGYRTVKFQFRVINFSDPEVDEVMFEHQYNSSLQHFSSKQEAYSAAFDYILKELI
jgi:hypothetical protein